jgi:hypothetical protein
MRGHQGRSAEHEGGSGGQRNAGKLFGLAHSIVPHPSIWLMPTRSKLCFSRTGASIAVISTG